MSFSGGLFDNNFQFDVTTKGWSTATPKLSSIAQPQLIQQQNPIAFPQNPKLPKLPKLKLDVDVDAGVDLSNLKVGTDLSNVDTGIELPKTGDVDFSGAEKLAKEAQKKIGEVTETVEEGVKEAGKVVGDVVGEAQKAVSPVTEAIEEGVKTGVEKTGEAIGEAQKAVSPVTEKAEEWVKTAKKATDDAVEMLGDHIDPVLKEAQKAVSPFTEAIEEGAKDVVEKTGDVIGEGQKAVQPVLDKVNEIGDFVSKGVTSVGDVLNNATKDLQKDIGKSLSGVADALGETGKNVQEFMKDAQVREGDGTKYGEVKLGKSGYVVDVSAQMDKTIDTVFKGTGLEGQGQELFRAITNPNEFATEKGKELLTKNGMVGEDVDKIVEALDNPEEFLKTKGVEEGTKFALDKLGRQSDQLLGGGISAGLKKLIDGGDVKGALEAGGKAYVNGMATKMLSGVANAIVPGLGFLLEGVGALLGGLNLFKPSKHRKKRMLSHKHRRAEENAEKAVDEWIAGRPIEDRENLRKNKVKILNTYLRTLDEKFRGKRVDKFGGSNKEKLRKKYAEHREKRFANLGEYQLGYTYHGDKKETSKKRDERRLRAGKDTVKGERWAKARASDQYAKDKEDFKKRYDSANKTMRSRIGHKSYTYTVPNLYARARLNKEFKKKYGHGINEKFDQEEYDKKLSERQKKIQDKYQKKQAEISAKEKAHEENFKKNFDKYKKNASNAKKLKGDIRHWLYNTERASTKGKKKYKKRLKKARSKFKKRYGIDFKYYGTPRFDRKMSQLLGESKPPSSKTTPKQSDPKGIQSITKDKKQAKPQVGKDIKLWRKKRKGKTKR